MRRLISLLIFVCTATAFGADAGHVKGLTFLQGKWAATVEGERWEEQWMAPSGDSAVGVCRAMKNGRTFFYEVLTVEQDEAGAVLRMKHFNRGLVGWEEKDVAVEVPLVSLTGNEVVFAKDDGSLRITYRRTGTDELLAIVERTKKGKPVTTEFRYTRQP
ncbi:MAG: DUF6265 family protein [Thermoanaerobaculia bacterium]